MAVSVKYATYDDVADLAGSTAAEIREMYQDDWNIDPESPGVVNGDQVEDDYTVMEGDKLEFVKKAEEKWS